MVSFGHGFGINGLCAYKFLYWGPPLMTTGIFTIQEQTQRCSFSLNEVGSPVGTFKRIQSTMGGRVINQYTALVGTTTLCQF